MNLREWRYAFLRCSDSMVSQWRRLAVRTEGSPASGPQSGIFVDFICEQLGLWVPDNIRLIGDVLVFQVPSRLQVGSLFYQLFWAGSNPGASNPT